MSHGFVHPSRTDAAANLQHRLRILNPQCAGPLLRTGFAIRNLLVSLSEILIPTVFACLR